MMTTRQLFTTVFSSLLIMSGPLAAGAALAQGVSGQASTGSASGAQTAPASQPPERPEPETGASPQASQPQAPSQGQPQSQPSTATPAATTPATTPAQATPPPEPRNDARLDPAEPDFTLVTLPTTLRLPQFKSAFRVTHRFTRPLGQGSFGDLASDFFALDSGARIGLEYRFGLLPGVQVGINRTSERTIQLFTQYDLRDQSASWPVGLSVWGSIDGTNNFRDSYSPTLGLIVSRKVHRHAALYVEPIWVNNSNLLPSELADHNSTFMIGVGGRVRVRPTVYVLAEAVPRVSGYKPERTAMSFAVEKRVGGHSFQLNFSNAIGTTMGQIAQGGPESREWFLGFNITRKFF